MRRLFMVAAALLVLLVASAPAIADPPSQSGVVERPAMPFGLAFEDPGDGLVALGGPPPEEGCFSLGFEEVPVHLVATPTGALVVRVHDSTEAFFIYAASTIGEICDSVYNGVVPEPIATGTARVVFNDNDAFGSGTRGNSWGGTAIGTVYDSDGGEWGFHATVRLRVTPNGDFRIVHEDIRLVAKGA